MNIQDGTAKFRVRDKGTDRVPTGIVEFFAGSKAPKGWLVCDGSAVSRTDYDELFEVIGTTYGAGDGSSTFNLPNLIDRFAEGGKSVGTKKEAGLPNITGQFKIAGFVNGGIDLTSGCFSYINPPGNVAVQGNSQEGVLYSGSGNGYFDASRSNALYGSSTTVQPPSLVLLPIIKC